MISTRTPGRSKPHEPQDAKAPRAVESIAPAEEYRRPKLNPDIASASRVRERPGVEEDPERWDGMS